MLGFKDFYTKIKSCLLGKCSIRTCRIRMKNMRNSPKKIQISMNLMLAVFGSLAAMELLRVYITSIAVIAIGTLVLKCSLRKYKVAFENKSMKISKSFKIIFQKKT